MSHTITGWNAAGQTVTVVFTDYEIRDEAGNIIATHND